ncbi:hypothetical protein N0V83_009338 [Neocucurbitaria cava]|uniref:Protein kinase domain-containing protein n=1 Tax=Neocucurbitaria cava TaxID=798079 RepID=A0A9W9CI68_9PLEO|nr:hypothetical protein N0V83_009338 [Neocucurbitaria cava]
MPALKTMDHMGRLQPRQNTHKIYPVDGSLDLKPFTNDEPEESRTITIKRHFKEAKASGAVVLCTYDSRVIKIYDPAFYRTAQDADADDEFNKEKAAYESIKGSLAHKHIAHGFRHGTLGKNDIPYIMINEVVGTPLADYNLEEETSKEDKEAIMRKFIEADSEILFEARVNNYHVRPWNVIKTPDGDIRIIDFGQSTVIEVKGIAKAYQTPPFRWVRRAAQWADYGWFGSREEALEWMWKEWGLGRKEQVGKGPTSRTRGLDGRLTRLG